MKFELQYNSHALTYNIHSVQDCIMHLGAIKWCT